MTPEQIANIDGDWQKAKDAAWLKEHKMDWLGLEATLRAWVRESKNTQVDEILAAFTKRGYELGETI